MKSFTLSNFKGIAGPLSIDFSTNNQNTKDQNLILYSENGGGKSSIAEAFRVLFLNNELVNLKINPAITGQERENAISSYWSSFLHDPSYDSFSLQIDAKRKFPADEAEVADITDPDIMILCRHDLVPTSRISIKDLIRRDNFKCKIPHDQLFSDENINLVIDKTNLILSDFFKESFNIMKLQEEGLFIGINGILPSGHIGENINERVNEARQNLIKILIFFSFLKLVHNQKREQSFVVLDDIMSSLDLANRIVLARYLVDLGKSMQLLVLTHNVGFFNLMKSVANFSRNTDLWKFGSLYSFDGRHEIHFPTDDNLVKILKRHGGRISPADQEALNSLRKRLEYLLHEFDKTLMLGIQEETKDLIGKICVGDRNLYYSVQGTEVKTYKDLLNSIRAIIKNAPPEFLKEKIEKCFADYDSSNQFNFIADTIAHLAVYQKMVLHPASHDSYGGQPTVSEKEIVMTISLIKRLESITSSSSASYPYFL